MPPSRRSTWAPATTSRSRSGSPGGNRTPPAAASTAAAGAGALEKDEDQSVAAARIAGPRRDPERVHLDPARLRRLDRYERAGVDRPGAVHVDIRVGAAGHAVLAAQFDDGTAVRAGALGHPELRDDPPDRIQDGQRGFAGKGLGGQDHGARRRRGERPGPGLVRAVEGFRGGAAEDEERQRGREQAGTEHGEVTMAGEG